MLGTQTGLDVSNPKNSLACKTTQQVALSPFFFFGGGDDSKNCIIQSFSLSPGRTLILAHVREGRRHADLLQEKCLL